MDKTFRTLLVLFVAVAAIQIGVVVVSLRNIQRSANASAWVNHTHAFLAELQGTVSSVRAAEGSLHAYILTTSPLHQEEFRDQFALLAEHVEVAKALAAADETNATDMAALETLLQDRAEAARELLAAHRAGDTAAVKAHLSGEASEAPHLEIIRLAQRMRSRNEELLNRQDQDAFRYDQTSRHTLYLGAALNLLLLLGAAWFIRDDLASRRRAAALLAATNEQLEARVRERTAELVEANRQLKAENLESRWKNQALAHQLRYNHLIFDSISDLVIVITKACNISRVNPAVPRATGRDVAELIDQPLQEIVSLATTQGAAPLLDPVVDALRSGHELHNRPAALLDRNGQARLAQLSLFPLRDNDKVVGGVVTLRLAASA